MFSKQDWWIRPNICIFLQYIYFPNNINKLQIGMNGQQIVESYI